MVRFNSLLVLCLLFSTSFSMKCFIGAEDDIAVEHGFDFCVTIMNAETKLMSYGGRTGATKVFNKKADDLSLADCFVDVEHGTNNISCYCKGSECNAKMTPAQFYKMLISHHPC